MSIAMRGVRSCPRRLFPTIYNRVADGARLEPPQPLPLPVWPTLDLWSLTVDGRTWRLRDPKDAIRITHVAGPWSETRGYRRLLEKYQLPGFVELAADDRVLDVGAFIGEFAVAVAETDAEVVAAVEPDPDNATALRSNVDCEVIERAVYDEGGIGVEFTVADDGTESGLLTPDGGGGETTTLETTTLSRLVRTHEPTFVKVEAEGVEPEILDGLGECRPAKIAVDASPERDGEAAVAACVNRLSALGYEVRLDNQIVFGRWGGDD